MNKLNEQLKAISGFVVGVVGVIFTRFMTGESTIPAVDPFDVQGWGTVFGVAALVYAGVYVPPNALSVKQLDYGLAKLPDPKQKALVRKYERDPSDPLGQ